MERQITINLYAILGIAIALSMDAFAVAIATGISLKKVNFRQTFRLSWHFGLFQAIMPIAGWLAGRSVYHWIERVDHWIAFVFLTFIGIRMMVEFSKNEEENPKTCDPTKGMSLVILSVATSIDAFAVGLSLSLLGISIWYPAVIIGHVTLLFTAFGMHIGRWIHYAPRLSNYAQLIGGMVLVGIGINILCEHGIFG